CLSPRDTSQHRDFVLLTHHIRCGRKQHMVCFARRQTNRLADARDTDNRAQRSFAPVKQTQ
ncbi:hypothetical protein ACTHTP_11540, partial [Neisseria sp. P0017.S001]|uniref:hypothetical protein n=1 Tax=Neisseria sp. P0017.S001 TaxID=3436777 RepID=UPI003F7CD54A